MSNNELARRRIVEAYIDKVIQEDALQIGKDRETYDRLGNRLGYISLNTGEAGQFAINTLRDQGRAVYSGNATRCIVAALCNPNIGVSMAHFNTVTRERLIRAGIASLDVTLAEAEKRHQKFMGDHRALVRSMVSLEDTQQTALQTLEEASRRYALLCGGSIPSATRLLVCGAFHLYPKDVRSVEDVFRDKLNNMRINPRNLSSKIGQATGVMFGYKGHRSFPGIGYYNMRRFEST